MGRPEQRRWAVLGGALVLLAGLGFVRSRGGLTEVMKMAPKVDASTPAVQGDFELLGAERTTEEERSPHLIVGEMSVGGGITGPVGSTRIWFLLPPATGKGLSVPGDDELQTYVGFPNGERYPVRWEVGDLSQRVATLLVPGGYPPSDWMEISVEGTLGNAKWRLQRLPQTPYALPKTGNATAKAEGMRLAASGVALARKGLGSGIGEPRPVTLRLDYTTDPPSPLRGKGTRLIWESFVPEYQHPADAPKQTTLGISPPGERKGSMDVSFPYADLMRHIVARGRFETWEPVRELVTFKNVRWTWRISYDAGKVLYLEADKLQLDDGSFLTLEGMVPVEKDGTLAEKPFLKGHYTPPLGKEREAHRYRSVVNPIPDATMKDWEAKLRAFVKSGDPKGEVVLGSVSGTSESYRVVRKTPFELLVPVRPATVEEIAKEKAMIRRAGRDPHRDLRRLLRPVQTRRSEVKSKPLIVE